jgi:hypothetical protein
VTAFAGLTTLVASALLMFGGTATADLDQQLTTATTCTAGGKEFVTNVANRPDSGKHGDWAHDTFVRTTTVELMADCSFVIKVNDEGTFTTIANAKSPETGVVLPNTPVKGQFTGVATISGKLSEPTEPQDPVAGASGQYSTGQWANLVFPGVGDVGPSPWGWTYERCHGAERWVNSHNGNSGDVVAKSCNRPVPPKPKFGIGIKDAQDCKSGTTVTEATATVKLYALTNKPHGGTTATWASTDGQSGTLTLPPNGTVVKHEITFETDTANDGKVDVKIKHGKHNVVRTHGIVVDCDVVPPSTPPTVPTVPTVPTTPEQPVQFENCDDVRAAGAAPIRFGDDGWKPEFDEDKDGLGCEVYESKPYQPVNNVANDAKDRDLAYTGTSGTEQILWIGGGLFVLGTVLLVTLRLRSRGEHGGRSDVDRS